MRNILLCCLSVALIIFMIPSAFAADIDSSNNFDINIETLDQTSTISEIAVTKGGSKSIRIELSREVSSSFNGTVSIEISGVPTGLSTSVSQQSFEYFLLGSTTKNSTLILTPQLSAQTGNYQITIKAVNSGDSTDYAQKTITLYISDFEITADKSTISLRPGQQEDVTLTIRSAKDTNNVDTRFSGPVELESVSMTGATITYIGDINVPEGGEDTITVRVIANSNAEANGDGVLLNLKGKVGTLEHTISLRVKILSNPLSITLSTDSPSLTIFQPTTITATVTDSSGNPVSDASVTLQRIGGNGTFVNLATYVTGTTDANGKFSGTFTAKTSETITIRGDADKPNYAKDENNLVLTVKGGFLLSITPDANQINAGDSKSLTLTIQSTDGFSSQVELSHENMEIGITLSFLENKLTPEANGATTTTVTVFIDSNVEPGTHSVQIKGKSGDLTSSASFSVEVPIAEFTLSLSKAELQMWQGDTERIKLVLIPVGGFSDTIELRTNLDNREDIVITFSDRTVPLDQSQTKEVELFIKTTTETPAEPTPLIITATSLKSDTTATVWLDILKLFELTIGSTSKENGDNIATIILTCNETTTVKCGSTAGGECENVCTKQPEQLPFTKLVKQGSSWTIRLDKEIIPEDDSTRYKFNSWSDDDVNLEKVLEIEGSMIFTAEFDREFLLNIRTSPVGEFLGLIDAKGAGWHKENSIITLSTIEILDISEGERYRFNKWTGAITADQFNLDLMIDGPKTIYAEYIKQYKLTKIVEPPFLINLVTTFDEEWVDDGYELQLEATKKVDEYGFMQWVIESADGSEQRTANPTNLIVTKPLTIKIQYDLLPMVMIESIRMSNTGFEGESSQIWVTLSNTELRGGYVVIKTSTNINGLIIWPTEKEIYLEPNSETSYAFSVNYTRTGEGSINIILEKTGSNNKEANKELKIFSMNDKRQIANIGKVLGAKYLPTMNELMIPDEKVKICASEILEQSRVNENALEIDKVKVILQFVGDKIENAQDVNMRKASDIVEEFGISGCINNGNKIEGDSRTSQILFGSLLRSLEIEVRPVIGTMSSSADNKVPSALMKTWVEANIDDQWLVIEPSTMIISSDIEMPINIKEKLNFRLAYAAIPEHGGVLSALIYDCITICNVDITNEYRFSDSLISIGSIILVDGIVNIEVQDSNKNFIANGSKSNYQWSNNDRMVKTQNPVSMILLSEGVDLEYISIIINGELGTNFELYGMKIIDFEPQTRTLKSSLISKSSLEFRITTKESDFMITEFSELKFDDTKIEILSTSSLISHIEQKRIDAIQLTIAKNENYNLMSIIKIPNSLFSEMESDSSRIIVTMNDKTIPVEIIDEGLIITIIINSLEDNLPENKITIYLKSYKVTVELRDPFNRIINNADITMIGEVQNKTLTSEESVFDKLTPGNYKFFIEYRGEQEEITKRITNGDVELQVNMYRSDSMITFITAGIFTIIIILSFIINKAMERILPNYNNNKRDLS